MEIFSDSIRLDAVLARPDRTPCPLVIIIHGFTGNKDEAHLLAADSAIRSEGFATLRVDMYGHGKSGGSFREHTLYKWLTNILSVYDYARSLDFVTDIYLCGHSQGGLAVMLAAGMLPDRIAGLIPLSPATTIPDGARQGSLLGQPFDPAHVPDELSGFGQPLSGHYVRAAQTLFVEPAIRRYRGPVLLVHGDADETVPISCSEEAERLYPHAALVTIPGDTHCFDRHMDRMADAIARWLHAQKEGKFETNTRR